MDEEQIFLRAVELRTPQQQVAFLDEACGADSRLRASVASLLKHHAVAGAFLEAPPAGSLTPNQSLLISAIFSLNRRERRGR